MPTKEAPRITEADIARIRQTHHAMGVAIEELFAACVMGDERIAELERRCGSTDRAADQKRRERAAMHRGITSIPGDPVANVERAANLMGGAA